MMRSILFAGMFAGVTLTAQAQSDPWTAHGDWVSSAIQGCTESADAIGACTTFAGEALDRLLGASEFCGSDSCMLMAQIESELRNNPDRWQLVGGATDQAVLDKARELAASGKIVIAAQSEESLGQVAIIMPGQPVPSGKWGMDRVPLGAAARPDAPEKSVYGKGINWVFSDPSKVTLYSRR